uniref:Glycosyltransferase family 92 protein n=1 Tax=Strongyloides venezuelensis TaxID=75913 RepID=A0A0K0G0J7_STRVS
MRNIKFSLKIYTILFFVVLFLILKLRKNDENYKNIIKDIELRDKLKKQNGINSKIFLLHEAYIFNDDPLFGNNTAVTLFSADVNFPNHNEILCYSKNGSFSKAKIELAAPLFVGETKCQWNVFRSECHVEKNSSSFYLSREKTHENNFVEVHLKKPEKAVDIAVCYGHSFMLDEWQGLITAIELYNFLGASIQQFYWRSGRIEIYNLLKMYEKFGAIKVDLFGPVINDKLTEMLGFDVQYEIPTRSYIASINDCFLKYRNAKFVLVIDADELYIPQHGRSIIDEMNYLSSLNPHANSFHFARYDASSIAFQSPFSFDMKSTLSSLKISDNKRNLGKSVIIPKKAKGTHQHFPSYYKSDTKTVFIPPDFNYIIHNTKVTLINDNESSSIDKDYDKRHTIFKWLSMTKLNELNNLFNDQIKNTHLFKNLNSNYSYKNILLRCKGELMEKLWLRYDVCIENYDYCSFKESLNLSCISAKTNYKFYNLEDGLVMFKKINTTEKFSMRGCTY